jgi:hypothetical protein
VPKGRYINWEPWDSLLGTRPDTDLAKDIGCDDAAVRARRIKLGVKPFYYPIWSHEDQVLLERGEQRCLDCGFVGEIDFFPGETSNHRGRYCGVCVNKRQRNRRRKHKQDLIDLGGGKCQNCEFQTYLPSLQFHHVEKPKLFNPSEVNRHTKEELTTEISKCCLLCSNCHDAYHGGDLSLVFVKGDKYWTVRSSETPTSFPNTLPDEDKGSPKSFEENHDVF